MSLHGRLNSRPSRSIARHRRAEPDWVALRDDELLDLRMCDLNLKIEGTPLEARIQQLYSELERKKIRLRPHCWLSDEWFSPDGVPGIAIPFYLAHPRLTKLESRLMHDVEGGTRDWCMRILRHEAGHALDSAFLLHRRRTWQAVFGKATQPYPKYYSPKPHSRDYVLHLDMWYAQSHPAEDFAETFAVWLKPDSKWRKRYSGWPALEKLEYVASLMAKIADATPRVRSREHIEPLSEMRQTLRSHYESRQALYGTEYPEMYDRDLRRLFSADPRFARKESASAFLRRVRRDLRKSVGERTGEYQYATDQVLQEMIVRCRQLKLRRHLAERRAKQEATMLLTVHTMNYVHSDHHRVIL